MLTLLDKIKIRHAHLQYQRRYSGFKRRVLQDTDYISEIDAEPVGNCQWPSGAEIAFCFGLDDASLMDGTAGSIDYGGKEKGDVWLHFEEMLYELPHVKHTVFFVPSPAFYQNGLTGKENYQQKFSLEFTKNHTFLGWLKDLEQQGVVEVAQHGLCHFQSKCKHYYPLCEFEFLSAEECYQRCTKGRTLMEEAGFKLVGFKPPCWAIGNGSDKALLSALKKLDYSYVSLSTPNNGLNFYKKTVSHAQPEFVQSSVNIPQNINMTWKDEICKAVIDRLIEKRGVVYPQLHFTQKSEYMADGLCDEMTEKLKRICNYVEKKCCGRVWYATMSQLADVFKEKYCMKKEMLTANKEAFAKKV